MQARRGLLAVPGSQTALETPGTSMPTGWLFPLFPLFPPENNAPGCKALLRRILHHAD